MGNVAGMEGLLASLESLKTNAAKSALRFASRKAAKVVQAEAQSRAPVGTVAHKTYKGRLVPPGYLSRHINVAVNYNRDRGVVRARIGPSREAFYGSQFVELGTSTMPKRPWLVPAYESVRGEVEATFVRELRTAIARSIKRGKTR